MKIKKYTSIPSFFEDNLTFLEQEEAINNLLIGIPMFMQNSEHSLYSEINLYAAFENEKPVFCLVQTPPMNFLIYGKLEKSTLVFEALIPQLVADKIEASGIIGPNDLAIDFAKAWKGKTGQDWRLNFEQLVYQLDELTEIKYADGELRKAELKDLPLIKEWFGAFAIEAMNEQDTSEMEAAAKKKIESETCFSGRLRTARPYRWQVLLGQPGMVLA